MVNEQPFVVHSPGMTTSHRTGSTFSGKRSDTNVEMIEVFPTPATHDSVQAPIQSPITMIRIFFFIHTKLKEATFLPERVCKQMTHDIEHAITTLETNYSS